MKFVYSLRRRRYIIGIVALLLVGFTATGLWRSAANRKESHLKAAQMKREYYAKIKKGVGSEVRFANARSSSDEIRASVDSVATFISERSNLGMSEKTKDSLAEMERDSLQSGTRITTAELSDALADTIKERIVALEDYEIDGMEKSLNPSGKEVSLRADGKYRLPKEEFSSEARKLRDQVVANDAAVSEGIRSIVSDEVEQRAAVLSEAAPEQFAGAPTAGLTPVQAMVITYSILTDDNLADSSNDVKQSSRQSPKRDGKRDESDRAYGPHGRLFSSPSHLVFNQDVMGRFLGRIKKGGNEQ